MTRIISVSYHEAHAIHHIPCYDPLMLTMTNGDRFEVVHIFAGERRAIVNDSGAYVMVNRVTPDTWEFGEPARPGEELDMLNALVRATGEGTTVKVTDPSGGETVYRDDADIIRENDE